MTKHKAEPGSDPGYAATVRIAAIQCRAILDDAVAVCDAIVQRLRWAATEGVDLIVFPEAFLMGHSYDSATIRLRARQASSFALAELCRTAAAFPTTLVVGAFDLIDGYIFNRAFVIECGRIVGYYAKAYPNEPGVSAGESFPTFVRSGTRYGINICNDANHPDAAEKLADQQAHLILYPLNNMLSPETAERWRARSLANLVDRARQTGCWVVSSDVTGVRDDRVSYGCTAIVAPDGRVVARVPELEEGVIMFDLPDIQTLAG